MFGGDSSYETIMQAINDDARAKVGQVWILCCFSTETESKKIVIECTNRVPHEIECALGEMGINIYAPEPCSQFVSEHLPGQLQRALMRSSASRFDSFRPHEDKTVIQILEKNVCCLLYAGYLTMFHHRARFRRPAKQGCAG